MFLTEDQIREIACWLVIIGGLNWGIIACCNKDLVKMINEKTFKSDNFVKGIYLAVGISAAYLLVMKLQEMDVLKLFIQSTNKVAGKI